MDVWHLVFRPESLTYTVCRALAECGHRVSVWVAEAESGGRAESAIHRRVAGIPGVRIFGRDATQLPASIGTLVVQTFPRPVEVLQELPRLAPRARAITLISAGDRSRGWGDAMKLQWLEARALGAALRRVGRVLYKDGPHGADLFGAFRRREVVGFDVHSQFLSQPEAFAAMHAADWSADAPRPILANFLGSRDPRSRLVILDAVRHLFVAAGGEPVQPRAGKRMLWCEYSDAQPGGLPSSEFVSTLTESDFTLCPRGYSLVTHRPIEALLRGSVPVLDETETDLYGVALVDGRNCVAVRAGDWAGAVQRLANFTEADIAAMRRHVHAMHETLSYGVLAAGICARLGVPPAADAVAARSAAGGAAG